jgi:corrinoid protein of di/trimethylamine methyltransferase
MIFTPHSPSDLNEELAQAVMAYDQERSRALAKEVVTKGLNPLRAIDEGLARGLRQVGDLFGRREAFLPELVMAAEAMKAGLEVLEPELRKKSKGRSFRGRLLIGTVRGDIHDIGKAIVGSILAARGYEVIDLGVDVPDEKFVEKVRELKPDILGLSALMTTTTLGQRDVIEALKKARIRDSVTVLVGGAAVTSDWARQIGADGCAKDASEALELCERLLGRKTSQTELR